MTDDLTKRQSGQILRGVKAVHEENHPGTPLCAGTPVCPHAAAERIGISPVGRWYAATLTYLEEERVLERNAEARASDAGSALYVLGENAAGMKRS